MPHAAAGARRHFFEPFPLEEFCAPYSHIRKNVEKEGK